jgi:hypothetical protein
MHTGDNHLQETAKVQPDESARRRNHQKRPGGAIGLRDLVSGRQEDAETGEVKPKSS